LTYLIFDLTLTMTVGKILRMQ